MTPSQPEARRRVAFAVLGPVARLATHWGLPLRETKQLIELAYYAEGRRQKLKMRELTELLSVSMSKLGLLSKELKAVFDEAEAGLSLSRRILSVLWAGSLSEARIAGALGDVPAAEVSATLQQMLTDRLLELEPGRTPKYRLADARYRLAKEPWMARFDALRNLMTAVAQTVEARFERNDDRAFVRTLAFRIRPEDLPELRRLYEETILPLVVELDRRATESGHLTVPMNLVSLWTPDLDALQDEAAAAGQPGDDK